MNLYVPREHLNWNLAKNSARGNRHETAAV